MKPAERHEAAAKVLEAAKAQKRAELRARLEEAGWSSVIVKAIGGFTAAGGIDPQGNTRSGCRADGEALIDDLLALGIPNERKRNNGSGPNGEDDGLRVDSGDPGSGDTGSDDHLGYDLDAELNEAIEDHPELFSQPDPEKEALREQVADLQRQIAERDAEPPPLSPDPVKHMIPEEIRKLMEDGESLSNAKRRLTELLWVEQAELRNLRGTDRGDLKREAEIERLLGLFARLGEI